MHTANSPTSHRGPNLTPMVDVVMCILIFFMLACSFSMPELYLNLPTPPAITNIDHNGTSTSTIPAVRCYIRLTRLGDQTLATAFGTAPNPDLVTLSTDPNSTASLPDLLRVKARQLSPDVPIIIAPDHGVPYHAVLAVYDACHNARFEHITFAP